MSQHYILPGAVAGFVDALAWGDTPIPASAIPVAPDVFRELRAAVQAGQEVVIVDDVPVARTKVAPELTHDELVVRAHAQRRAAYAAESDPIKNEADYDALVSGRTPDYTAWMAAVEAIKERIPLPKLESVAL